MCCFEMKREHQISTHKTHGMCSYVADFLLIIIVLLYLGDSVTDTDGDYCDYYNREHGVKKNFYHPH